MAKAIYNGIVRKYTPKALICDGRPIQKDTAKENLKIFIEFAQKYKLQYFLLYGSLLGAVRDKDFITYDEDIDLGLFTDDYALLYEKLDELLALGFNLVRFDERGQLSIMRNGEYIDVMEFHKRDENTYISCNIYYYPNEFIEKTKLIEFKGMMVSVPENSEEHLRYEFGDTWNIPIEYKGRHTAIKQIFAKFKSYVKMILPKSLKLKIWEKTGAKMRVDYDKKYEQYCKEQQK